MLAGKGQDKQSDECIMLPLFMLVNVVGIEQVDQFS
jgi:hypothetical protein